MHSKNLIHRDIKPNNIVLAHSSSGTATVYLIDFGLARKIKEPTKEGQPKQRKSFVGTPYFSSINALHCYGKFVYMHVLFCWSHSSRLSEQSPRDDLESLAYVLIYFLRQGRMPWDNLALLPADAKPSYMYLSLLAIRKLNVCNDKAGLRIPSTFQEFLDHARSLNYGDIPDYDGFKRAFREVAEFEEMRESALM